jgi:DNA end-binding protein Ku
MATRAIGTGTISFGLVSIPVRVYTATSSEAVSFNLVHKKCKGRIKQQIFCPTDNEVVERTDLVRGFEYSKNQYVLFTDEELEALESERTNSLEIVEFVPASTVDWLYISKTYYLGPDKGGDKAYKLLSEAMERTDKIAVGRYWTRGKEQLVLLRPYKSGLILHYAYYANEVRSFDEVDTGATVTFKPIEAELADKLIAQLTIPEFRPEQYRDEYVERVKHAVEQKIAGQEVSISPEQPPAQIIDLFEALKRSLTEASAANDAKTSASQAGAVAESNQSAAEAGSAADAMPPKKAVPRKTARGAKPATG